MESRNPTIVRILEEKGSVIENRHSDIPTMIREMKSYGLPEPNFYEERDSFKVVFRNSVVYNESLSGAQSGEMVNDDKLNLILQYCDEPKSLNDISLLLNISSKRYIRERIIRPLINQGRKPEKFSGIVEIPEEKRISFRYSIEN